MRSCAHDRLERRRGRGAGVRAPCAGTVRRPQAQDDRHPASRRFTADLRRDPRFALHSATIDPVEGYEAQWPGEAKLSGRAIAAGQITDGPTGDRFHADIADVVHTHLNEAATLLVVEWWTPAHGLRTIERE